MVAQPPTRDAEIKAIWKEYKFTYQIIGGLLLVGIGIYIGMIAFSAPADRTGYLINLYTSVLSILVTVFVIDFLNRRRDEQHQLRELQQQLIRDAGSTSNEIAKNAVDQLRKRGWLEGNDGLLRRTDLFRANLQGANLYDANLQDTKLSSANLQGASLSGTNLQGSSLYIANLQGAMLASANLQGSNLSNAKLQGANLYHAKLQGADLSNADLQAADLRDANLQDTKLSRAKLQGANLYRANLQGADLSNADLHGQLPYFPVEFTKLDETTVLPDGTHWTLDTDLTQFGCIVE